MEHFTRLGQTDSSERIMSEKERSELNGSSDMKDPF